MTEQQIQAFYNNALRASYSSPDEETKVGCVIVSDNLEILSEGYNGFLKDSMDLPTKRPEKYEYIIHAEQAAIYEAARKGEKIEGASAVVTLSPCIDCCRALFMSGINKIYFKGVHSSFKDTINAKDFNIVLTEVGEFSKLVMEVL